MGVLKGLNRSMDRMINDETLCDTHPKCHAMQPENHLQWKPHLTQEQTQKGCIQVSCSPYGVDALQKGYHYELNHQCSPSE